MEIVDKPATGQTLHVTDGIGLTQVRGGDVVVIRPGDTIWCSPDEWHWHGAAPEHAMTHLAAWDGLRADWRQRDDPTIIEPTNAIIRLSATCICGSDLWSYRGLKPVEQPIVMGHEYV
jgi:hypothetical protein